MLSTAQCCCKPLGTRASVNRNSKRSATTPNDADARALQHIAPTAATTRIDAQAAAATVAFGGQRPAAKGQSPDYRQLKLLATLMP